MTVKALVLNCSLKKGDEESNTEALVKKATGIMQREGVFVETVRVADYKVAFGISDDMGGGDEWPQIFEKVIEADILIIGTPLWIGEKSSIAAMVMERLYGGSSLTNEKGQSIYYNKVGGVVVTGNEDGAKDAAKSILYGLSHMGFTVPPNVDTYWVGEAGPGPSFIEADGHKNEFTKQHVQMLAFNLMHFARMLKGNPIPAQGTVIQ
ncbi:flavodoxin family protein [Metabacillus sp. KIGAM252]|uniref:Flavodoxin family protein n=1 Tax=Metabacillus flavus TaxID=2823519 RepID=A0ABS5LKQ6_9BACI|nr:flavodoxin family protein [Metabacillus flavus]MBS2970939.1 flavodoxin family protein [Metabacillus flavus]